jgi:ubiquinone/menaquinone biosynthesis C-methylase UbiE
VTAHAFQAPGSKRHTPSANLAAVYGAAKTFGRESLYLNLGYWDGGAADYDQAAEALADVVAERAHIGRDDVVLDAGFGFGDQDLRWMRHRAPQRIIGVNIVARHVAVARRRVAAAGLADKIELHQCDATRMPIRPGQVTRVVAVESALHFNSRTRFFSEAWRVLSNGGRIALTDILPRPNRGIMARMSDHLASSLWAIPPANMYDRSVYIRRLREAGFVDVEIEDLSHQVLVGFGKHIINLISDPAAIRRLGLAKLLQWHQSTRAMVNFEYVLVMARKPDLPVPAPYRQTGRVPAAAVEGEPAASADVETAAAPSGTTPPDATAPRGAP